MATVLDTVEAQLERVRPKLEMYFEQTTAISSLIGKAENVEIISRRLYRIPIHQYNGMHFNKFIGNEGSLGKGTGPKFNVLVAGFFYSSLAVRVTQEQIDTSMNNNQSVVSVLPLTLSQAMEEQRVHDDISFHNDGTGKLTNSSSAVATGANATMTFAGATDTLGVGRVREGMCVDVWDTTGATKRVPATGAPLIIINIDYIGKVVTFDQDITGLVSGDLIAFRNMDVYGPATLVSFTSTWPSTSAGGGLGGDSFRHGLYYANDATAANYFLGKQKSAISQLLPSRVNAAGAGLTFEQGLLVKDQLVQRRNPEVTTGLIGIAHMSQRAAVWKLGLAISNKLITGDKFGKTMDLGPDNSGYNETFEYLGMTCYLSKRQDRARFDFINPSACWGRAQLHGPDFHNMGGKKVFEGRTSAGEVSSYLEFFVVHPMDFVCFNPGSGGYIDNLALPSGY